MFEVAIRQPMPILRQCRITRFSEVKWRVLVALIGQVNLRGPAAFYAGNCKIALRDEACIVYVD